MWIYEGFQTSSWEFEFESCKVLINDVLWLWFAVKNEHKL